MAFDLVTTVITRAVAAALATGEPATVPPPGAYDLTTLALVKDELSLLSTDYSRDAFLQRAITQASRAISRHCGRVFPVETLQDQVFIQQDPYPFQVPGGLVEVQLKRWPIYSSASVTFTGNTSGSDAINGCSSTAGVIAGTLIFASDGSLPAGTTVTGVSPNQVVLSNPASSDTVGVSFTTGLQVTQILGSGQTQVLVPGTDYAVNAELGQLIRLDVWTNATVNWEPYPLTVVYQAGYNPIEDDLIEACLRQVTSRFSARGRDPMLVERSQPQALGTERYWVGAIPGGSGNFAPGVADLLDKYRTPVIG